MYCIQLLLCLLRKTTSCRISLTLKTRFVHGKKYISPRAFSSLLVERERENGRLDDEQRIEKFPFKNKRFAMISMCSYIEYAIRERNKAVKMFCSLLLKCYRSLKLRLVFVVTCNTCQTNIMFNFK
jgi:hypothetical protein